MDRRIKSSRPALSVRKVLTWTLIIIVVYFISSFALWGYSASKLIALSNVSAFSNSSSAAIGKTLQDSQHDAQRLFWYSNLLPIRMATQFPIVGNEIADARTLSLVANQLAPTLEVAASVGKSLTSEDKSQRIFADGRINIELVNDLIAQESVVSDSIYQADWTLTNSSCSSRLCAQFNDLHSKLERTKTLLGVVEPALPELPVSLGQKQPKRYLITIGNEAELRASGGAPLSIALMKIDNGYVTMERMGQISTEIFPGNPKVSWTHIMEMPFVSDSTQAIKFVNANMHPDFRIAGVEIVRGWAAHGGTPIDGVISVDSTALAAVLSATGPIQTPGFGEITGENFKRRMLIDAYRELSNDGQRQRVNNLIGQTLVTRATGSDFPKVARALLATAPGRHFQMYFTSEPLQRLNSQFHLDGTTPDKRSNFGSDIIALYSKNRNQAKSDVFQKRHIHQHVVIHQDGSADIERTIRVKSDVPAGVTGEGTIGYTTLLNSSYWCSYIPAFAQNVQMTVPQNYPEMVIYNNGADSKFAFTRGGEIQPGEEITMVLKYQLPAGSLKGSKYRVAFGPQPIATPLALTITVERDYGENSGQSLTLVKEQLIDGYMEFTT